MGKERKHMMCFADRAAPQFITCRLHAQGFQTVPVYVGSQLPTNNVATHRSPPTSRQDPWHGIFPPRRPRHLLRKIVWPKKSHRKKPTPSLNHGEWVARPNEETDLLNSGALEAGGGKGGIVLDPLGVVGLAEVEAEVVEVLALGKMMVIGIGQEGRAHAPDEGLGESVEDVEGGHIAGGRLRCRGRHICNVMLLEVRLVWGVASPVVCTMERIRCGRFSVLSWRVTGCWFSTGEGAGPPKSIVLRRKETHVMPLLFSPRQNEHIRPPTSNPVPR